jgi:hypothetical protein
VSGFVDDPDAVLPAPQPPHDPHPVSQPAFVAGAPRIPNPRRGRNRRATCSAAAATINPTRTPSSIVSLPPTRVPRGT